MNQTKRRFNCVDFFVLFLALGAVLALILQGNLARRIGLEDPGYKAEYTLYLKHLTEEDAALFAEGKKLSDPKTGEELGTILSAATAPDADNPPLVNLTITVLARGTNTERGFLLFGSIHASPGDRLAVCPEGESARRMEGTVLPNKATE